MTGLYFCTLLHIRNEDTVNFEIVSKLFHDLQYTDNSTNIIREKLSNGPLAALTHWGLVTPYGIGDLGQHWFR